MSSQEIIKGVSKKLKHYFELKRLEDGFDLSGPNCPRLDHPQLKARPTLMYDGLHDRPVKHYFSKEEIKQALTQFKSKKGQSGREKQIRQLLERYMKQYHFKESPLNAGYYRPNQKGGRKLKSNIVGFGIPTQKTKRPHKGGHPVLRSVPTQYASVGEANRLINAACKMLVTTETIDLNDSKGQQSKDTNSKGKEKRPQSAPESFESGDKLPPVNQHKRPQTSKGKKQRNSKSKYTDDEDSDQDSYRNSNDRGDSAYSTRPGSTTPNNMYKINGDQADKKEIKPWLRREMKKNGNSDGEDWVRPTSPMEPHPPRSERPGTSMRKPVEMGHILGRSDSLSSGSSASSDDENRNTQTQTGGELLRNYQPTEQVVQDGKQVKYRVHVYTGDKLGAATKADIKLVLIGDRGRTTELTLQESRNHKVKFQKGQEDIFDLDSYFVGELMKICIGHDRKEMGMDWYLDRVTVKDMAHCDQYDLPCESWLSDRSDDRTTFREFSVRACTKFTLEVEEKRDQTHRDNPEAHIAIVRTKPAVDESNRTERSYQSQAPKGSGPHTSTATHYSDRHQPRSRSDSETTDTTYTTTTFSESTVDEEKRDKEKVSPRGPPVRRRDDFFDQDVKDKDYSSVIESLSVTTDQDNREDFDNDQPVYAKRETRPRDSKPITVTPVESKNTAQDETKVTPGLLHKTTKSGDFKHLKDYLEQNPDLKNCTDDHGWTLLHTSAAEGHTDITQWLSVQIIDLECQTPTGNTPMHLAAMNGHLGCMRTLFAMGASVNSKTHSGETPLHLAAYSGELESVKYLVANRAELRPRDNSGQTPADAASHSSARGTDHCVTYLKQCENEEIKPGNFIELRSAPAPTAGRRATTPAQRDRPLSGHSTASMDSSGSSTSSSYSGSTSRTTTPRGYSNTASKPADGEMDARQKQKHDEDIMVKAELRWGLG